MGFVCILSVSVPYILIIHPKITFKLKNLRFSRWIQILTLRSKSTNCSNNVFAGFFGSNLSSTDVLSSICFALLSSKSLVNLLDLSNTWRFLCFVELILTPANRKINTQKKREKLHYFQNIITSPRVIFISILTYRFKLTLFSDQVSFKFYQI